MNYFEFYGIPVSFYPDEALLKKQFYALSKAYHPDFFAADSEDKQQEAIEKSTLNNKAWQVLSSFDKRLHYVLELKGLLEDGDKYTLPQQFLLEMMEVNEALMELEMEVNEEYFNALNKQVHDLEAEINQSIHVATTGFEMLNDAEQQRKLMQIKDFYYRRKYVLRIRDSLNRFATP